MKISFRFKIILCLESMSIWHLKGKHFCRKTHSNTHTAFEVKREGQKLGRNNSTTTKIAWFHAEAFRGCNQHLVFPLGSSFIDRILTRARAKIRCSSIVVRALFTFRVVLCTVLKSTSFKNASLFIGWVSKILHSEIKYVNNRYQKQPNQYLKLDWILTLGV